MKKIFLTILALMMLLTLTACGGSTPSNGSTMNGTAISYYSSNDGAVKAATTVISGNGNTLIVNLDKAIKCNITLTGQTSGRTYTASTSDGLADLTNGIKDIFGMTAIVRTGENTFSIDSTKFEDGETVVVNFNFVTSTDALDEKFGKGTSAEYWAFIVQQSGSQTSTAPVSTPPSGTISPSSSQPGGTSSSEPPEPSANPNGQGNSSAPQGSNGPQTSKLTSGTVYFNGFELQAWENFEDALNNAREITLNATKSAEITATVEEGIARVGIDVKNSNDGYQYKEYIIGPNCNWSATMSLEDMQNTTIVLVIGYQTEGIVPHVNYEYVAISVPATAD